ncbi:Protein of unknown function [Flavobacteriaceae bacterium MAR_2010_188]|nr:Protein of unknown function [Flavobacteriaceae bacterium MAR_2010_188]
MNKLPISVFAVTFALLSVSCNQNENKTEQEEVEISENETVPEPMQAPEIAFNDQDHSALWTDYLDLKTALVETNADNAKIAANQLSADLEKLDNESLKTLATTISNSQDIEEQRKAFSELSASMENVLKTSMSDGQIYKQFCPMAFDNKGGYWLSDSEEIRNPYFGSKMLKCGKVTETIEK